MRDRLKASTCIIITAMLKQHRWTMMAGMLCALGGFAAAQEHSPQAVRKAVREYRQQHEVDIVHSYAELLSLPNVAADSDNIRRNADIISTLLDQRGFDTLALAVPGAPPAVYGQLSSPGAKHTLLLYAHYDGQPVDKAQWASDPWQAVLRDGPVDGKTIPLDSLHAPLNPEWRIYARSASDDKAPIQALLTAIDALKAAKIPIGVNLKVFFEGEEEAGSPHLAEIFRQNGDVLKGDVWILSDGPVNQTRRPQLYFGARGVTDLELTVYGPARVLHDGHYGNWAPNPAATLVDLLAHMRNANSHILVPGFYDDVRALTADEKQAIAQSPQVDEQLKQELGLAWTESAGAALPLAITQPALNIRGIEAGHVEEKAQNAISTLAKASIDFRLVPNQTPERVHELVEKFITRQGFYIVRETPDIETRRQHARVIKVSWGPGYKAARTAMDDPAVRPIITAMEQTLSEQTGGTTVIKMPLLGGSVPMYLFTDVLQTPVVGLPIVNHDNNQHGANENLRLQNLWDGIEIFAGILAGAEKNWK
ncbi:MAG TPA: M20/M25/M40 family metallo-hydrolase [Candidatus Angelobacter sp.]|nr:M20/M25/M40 family metallo-hydrolase [Candidatus Angelobacter sp.]